MSIKDNGYMFNTKFIIEQYSNFEDDEDNIYCKGVPLAITEHQEYCDQLSSAQIARWFCLFNGIDAIFDRLEELDMLEQFGQDKKEVIKIDRCLAKYIQQCFQTMHADVIAEASKPIKP